MNTITVTASSGRSDCTVVVVGHCAARLPRLVETILARGRDHRVELLLLQVVVEHIGQRPIIFDDQHEANWLTPMERAGTPMEMAYGCLFMASDEASYVNGAILPIDGGTTARQ